MKVLIVGAGHAGFHLVKRLADGSNVISVIDHDEAKCRQLLIDGHQVIVYQGDGADVELLRKASIQDVELVVACTDHDPTNLKVCEYAKRDFGVHRVVGLSNSPKFKDEMAKYADVVICPVEYILDRFERAVEGAVVYPLYLDRDRDIRMVELQVRVDSQAVGKSIGEVLHGMRCTAALIYRGGANILPSDETVLQGGDRLFVVGGTLDVDRLTEAVAKKV